MEHNTGDERRRGNGRSSRIEMGERTGDEWMEHITGDERSGEGMGGVAGKRWRIGQGMREVGREWEE